MKDVFNKVRTLPKKFWLSDMEAVVVIMSMLIFIGTITISSASLITAYEDFDTPYFFLVRHVAFLAFSSVLFILIARFFNYRHLQNLGVPMLAVTIILLILVLVAGIDVNGARRWLPLGFMQFQPSEFAKFAMIIATASYLGRRLDKNLPVSLNPLKIRLPIFCGIIAYLVEKQPDMGTAMVIVAVPAFMYIVAGLDKRFVALLLFVLSVIAGLVATFQPYRLARLEVWYDPWSDPKDAGYQIVQSILAIGSGQFSGMGLGQGFSKYSYLPESHTDFAFAVYCQETGFIGVVLITVLILALAFYCTRIAARANDGFGKMLAVGLTMLVIGQAVGNMAMVIGLLPVIGVPMPFISYGGTSLLMNMMSIALIISIGRKSSAQNKTPAPPPPQDLRPYTAKNGKVTHLYRVK